MKSKTAVVVAIAAMSPAWPVPFLPFAPPARADLVLNEVLYDPPGVDSGSEFVELWNPDPVPRPLGGITVEACDGARPDAWSVVYRGAASDTVPASGAFLVAGAALSGTLQNGPDAVRLARDGATLDVLGYGALDAASLYEGAPAPEVASGHSLARVEDGRDQGSNADDWADEPSPTPGRANHPDARVVIVAGSVAASPVVPWPGERVVISARIQCRGRLPLDGSRWHLLVDRAGDGSPSSGGSDVGAVPLGETPGVSLESGESAAVSLALDAPPPGAFRLRVRTAAARPDDPAASDLADTAAVSGRTVAGPAVVSEIAFQDQGAGEWVELWIREAIADPGGVAIADGVSPPRPLVAADTGGSALPAGAWIVVAQDPPRFRARFAIDSGSLYGVAGAWPALNDADGSEGTADRVRIFVSGEPSDDVPYDARAAVRGRSLERLSPDLPGHDPGTWGESVDPAGGTPGRPNSLRAPDGGGTLRGDLIQASGRVVRMFGNAPPLLLRLTPEARGRTLDVVVRDLLGRPVRTLVRGQRFASEGVFSWNGRDDSGGPVPPGLYVVCADAEADPARGPRRTAIAVAVAPQEGAR